MMVGMESDLPTGTVTFLFTDVEGSTRLLGELGVEAYGALLAEHHRVCREACIWGLLSVSQLWQTPVRQTYGAGRRSPTSASCGLR